jgi:hypothetical protein
MPANNDYEPSLVKLMSFVDKVEYNKNHVFLQEKHLQLTPDMILRHFNVIAFGVPDPPLDANPTEARVSTL